MHKNPQPNSNDLAQRNFTVSCEDFLFNFTRPWRELKKCNLRSNSFPLVYEYSSFCEYQDMQRITTIREESMRQEKIDPSGVYSNWPRDSETRVRFTTRISKFVRAN